MNRKTLFFLFIVAVLLAILVKCPRDCKEQTVSTNPIQSKVDALTTEIKAIQSVQDMNATKVKAVEGKLKESPRVAKLLPKRSSILHRPACAFFARAGIDSIVSKKESVGITTNDSTTIFLNAKYDSVRHELLYKEMLNDSLLEITNRLLTNMLLERKKHDEKDSLNNELILSLNNKLDSAKTSKRRYWRGVKHGVVAGYVLGTATAILAK